MNYAFLGTRQPRLLAAPVVDLYCTAATSFAKQGGTIVCGATPGAEQLAAEAALAAGGNVELFLPWALYEREWVQRVKRQYGSQIRETVFMPSVHPEWLQAARAALPNGENLSTGSLALHARCYGMLARAGAVIVMPYVRLSWQVIERPTSFRRSLIGGISGVSQVRERTIDKGGAELAIRFAHNLECNAFDLSSEEDRVRLLSELQTPAFAD